MIIKSGGDSSAAGMDVFATLFVVFVMISSTVLMLVGQPTLPLKDRYLIVGYKLHNYTTHEFDIGLQLEWEDGTKSIIWKSKEDTAGSRKPVFKMSTDEPTEFFAIFENVSDGQFRLRLVEENSNHWDTAFGRQTATEICLYSKFPLKPADTNPPCERETRITDVETYVFKVRTPR